MFTLDMWLWIPAGQADTECLDFCAAEVSCSGDVLVSPRVDADKRTEQGHMIDDKSDILAWNDDEEVRGGDTECDDEERESRSQRRRRPCLIQDSPARENERIMRRLMRSAEVGASRVRGRGVEMKLFRGASAHDERMHTFVMDCCFPSEGDQQGITVLLVKEMKTKTVGAIVVRANEVSEYLRIWTSNPQE